MGAVGLGEMVDRRTGGRHRGRVVRTVTLTGYAGRPRRGHRRDHRHAAGRTGRAGTAGWTEGGAPRLYRGEIENLCHACWTRVPPSRLYATGITFASDRTRALRTRAPAGTADGPVGTLRAPVGTTHRTPDSASNALMRTSSSPVPRVLAPSPAEGRPLKTLPVRRAVAVDGEENPAIPGRPESTRKSHDCPAGNPPYAEPSTRRTYTPPPTTAHTNGPGIDTR